MSRYIRFNGDGEEGRARERGGSVFGYCLPEYVHLVHPINDYTLCGASLDNDEMTVGTHEDTHRGPVNCPHCVAIILHCRGVHVNREG